MFNIGSFEVLLLCVIALLVLGPERLPGAVRTAGLWLGRFRRSFYRVKAEIERELNADEVRRQLHNETVMAELESAKAEVTDLASELEDSANRIVDSTNLNPAAASYTEQQRQTADAESTAVNLASRTGEINDPSGQSVRPEAAGKQPLYGTGSNPKLAGGKENPTHSRQAAS